MAEGGGSLPAMQPSQSQVCATPDGEIFVKRRTNVWRPSREKLTGRNKIGEKWAFARRSYEQEIQYDSEEVTADEERLMQEQQEAAYSKALRVKERQYAKEERSFLGNFFLGEEETEEVAADEKRRRREQQEAAYRKALREKKARRDALRKEFMAHPTRLLSNPHPDPRYMMPRGRSSPAPALNSLPEEEEEECTDLEPFFFDEAEAVAEHVAGAEKRKQKEQEEVEKAREAEMLRRRWKFHMSVLDSMRDYDHRLKRSYFRRLYFIDLSTFDLDEESPLGPMRHTTGDDVFHLDSKVCKQGDERFMLLDSVNVLSVKVASSDLGFPINVYGTVIARDSLDKKCVYLFQRDRNHCQLINSEDNLLILTGPKRGLALKSYVYFEVDLKIKADQQVQKDKQLSNGFLMLDIIPRLTPWHKMKVETDSIKTKLGVLDVTYVVVKHAVEATVAIEVIEGEFDGKITACTSTIKNGLVLHDSKVAGVIICDGKRVVQMLRPTVAVFVKEKLEVTVAAQTVVGEVESTIIFTPRASGVVEDEITCGSIKMLVKVSWSIIACLPVGVNQ